MPTSTRTFLDPTLPLRFQRLVKSHLPARLRNLQLTILLLEPPSLLLTSKNFLNKGLLALFVLDPAREELSRTFDDSPDLTVLRRLHLSAVLFVVAVRVEHVTHLQELQVSLELGCKIGAGKVVPLGARSCFLLLVTMSADAPIDVADRVRQCGGSVSE